MKIQRKAFPLMLLTDLHGNKQLTLIHNEVPVGQKFKNIYAGYRMHYTIMARRHFLPTFL